MATTKEFYPLYLDFNDVTQDLSDAACGRLIRAIIDYANGEDYEDRLQSEEIVAFRFMKGYIDRNNALSATRADAGSKGGKKTQENASKRKQEQAKNNLLETEEAKSSKTTINTNTNNNNNTNINNNTEPLLDDGDAHEIQTEQNRVLDAAEDAGFKMSNDVRASLIALYAENGLQKMLDGFKACVEYGVPTLAYLKGVLKGVDKKPKQAKPPAKTVIAQQYEQRDYSGVQDDFDAMQRKRIEERLRGMNAG